jgi:hypothetical protein
MVFIEILNNLVVYHAINTLLLAVVRMIPVWPKLGKAVTKGHIKKQQTFYLAFAAFQE